MLRNDGFEKMVCVVGLVILCVVVIACLGVVCA